VPLAMLLLTAPSTQLPSNVYAILPTTMMASTPSVKVVPTPVLLASQLLPGALPVPVDPTECIIQQPTPAFALNTSTISISPMSAIPPVQHVSIPAPHA
jgi:hypothetical protein